MAQTNSHALFHELTFAVDNPTELKKVVVKAVKDAVKEYLDDIQLDLVKVEVHDVDKLNLQIRVKTNRGTHYYGVKVSEMY